MAPHTELKRGSADLMILAVLEKAGQRRRRYYTLLPAGTKVLAEQRASWHELLTALQRVARIDPIG